jgi:NAD(P)-dependent dehydrogenase (short-subunit alcohol dehydrogenase family)
MRAVIEGKRFLVVGASSGIGKAVATTLTARGGKVAFAARRADALAKAVADAGGGVAVVGDASLEEGCRSIVSDTVAAFGGIDAILYSAGVSPLRLLVDTTADDWHTVLGTNVIGAAQITRAAIPHMPEGSVVAYLSSEGAGRPRHGLVAYCASKVALEEMIRGYRTEHPELRFTKITVGATDGSEFGLAFDFETVATLFPLWVAHGQMKSTIMEVQTVAAVIADHLSSALEHPGADLQEIVVRPPGPLMTDAAELLSGFEEQTAATEGEA